MGGGGLKDGVKSAPTFHTSARDQTSHTKLKIRKPEQLVLPKPKQDQLFDSSSSSTLLLTDRKDEEEYEGEDNHLLPEGENCESEESGEDEELLRLEIEKIRKEREETRRRQAQDKKIKEQIDLAGKNNPLNDGSGSNDDEEEDSFQVKRKWTDDTIFRVDHCPSHPTTEKRFINDTIKSDFHRRFMDKYFK